MDETFKITTFITVDVKLKNVKTPIIYKLFYIDRDAAKSYLSYSYISNEYLGNMDKPFIESRQEIINTLPTNYHKSHCLHKALWFEFLNQITKYYKVDYGWDDIENVYLGTSSKIEKYESTISKLLRKVSNFFSTPDYNKED